MTSRRFLARLFDVKSVTAVGSIEYPIRSDRKMRASAEDEIVTSMTVLLLLEELAAATSLGRPNTLSTNDADVRAASKHEG